MENRVQQDLTVVVVPGATVIEDRSRDVATLFERETREALTEPYGDKRGFLELKVTTIETQPGLGWALVSGLTVFLPNLVGMPFSRWKITVSTQLDVLDRQRRLLATYRATGEAKSVGGLYSSSNYANPARVVYLQAVRESLVQIKTTMQPDLAQLQRQLQ